MPLHACGCHPGAGLQSAKARQRANAAPLRIARHGKRAPRSHPVEPLHDVCAQDWDWVCPNGFAAPL